MNRSKLLDYTLYGNPLSIITQYLDCKDIHTLKMTNPKFNKKIGINHLQQIIKIKFEALLESLLGEQSNTFYELLQKDNASISGSCILQLLLDEQWNNTDIDIYICGKNLKNQNNDMYDFLKNTNLFEIKTVTSYDKVLPTETCLITKLHNFTFKNKISHIIKFQIIKIGFDEKNIKNIEYKYEEPDQKIHHNAIDHYDFNTCKNMIYFDNNEFHFKIDNPDDVFNKFTSNINIKNKAYMNSLFSRVIKYSNRGFTFGDHDFKCKVLEYYIAKYVDLISFVFCNLKFNDLQNLKNNEKNIYGHMKCHQNCLFRLLFDNKIQHYHVIISQQRGVPYIYNSDHPNITEENTIIHINNENDIFCEQTIEKYKKDTKVTYRSIRFLNYNVDLNFNFIDYYKVKFDEEVNQCVEYECESDEEVNQCIEYEYNKYDGADGLM